MSNSNYEERNGGMWRKPEAPDARHESRIKWKRQENLEVIRQSISELRRRQNERNEEYKRRHGNG